MLLENAIWATSDWLSVCSSTLSEYQCLSSPLWSKLKYLHNQLMVSCAILCKNCWLSNDESYWLCWSPDFSSDATSRMILFFFLVLQTDPCLKCSSKERASPRMKKMCFSQCLKRNLLLWNTSIVCTACRCCNMLFDACRFYVNRRPSGRGGLLPSNAGRPRESWLTSLEDPKLRGHSW